LGGILMPEKRNYIDNINKPEGQDKEEPNVILYKEEWLQKLNEEDTHLT